MFKWFEEWNTKRVINRYSKSEKIVDLILAILGRDSETEGEDIFEDERIKIEYRNDNDNSTKIYKVWVKNEEELIPVFDRTRRYNEVNIKKFKIGYWIYHLYKVKHKGLTIKEVYAPELEAGKPKQERNRLLDVE